MWTALAGTRTDWIKGTPAIIYSNKQDRGVQTIRMAPTPGPLPGTTPTTPGTSTATTATSTTATSTTATLRPRSRIYHRSDGH